MPQHSNHNYNKHLKPLAKALRKEPTPGEHKLWKEVLSNAQMLGYKFSRQRAIDNYIVDFFCKDLMLVIEVDGTNHDWKVDEDKKRDARLAALGLRNISCDALYGNDGHCECGQNDRGADNGDTAGEGIEWSLKYIPHLTSPRGGTKYSFTLNVYA